MKFNLEARIINLENEIARLKHNLGLLDETEYFRSRVTRGSREKFDGVLAKASKRKPLLGDELLAPGQPVPSQPTQNQWWNKIAGSFKDDKDFKKAMWYGRQSRDSHVDLPPTSELKRLRRDYNAILNKLKSLGHFKTKQAAKEYAYREFAR